jgi:hypothetical protein
MLEIRHLHTRHHSLSATFAHVLKFDSNSVFEVVVIRYMCARMGVGVHFSASYGHHMLGKTERPWRIIRDNASAMLHSMSVPNFMWSCVVIIVVYLRNRTYSRVVGLSGGVPITLLTSTPPDASECRVFECNVLAKVPDKLRRKLAAKTRSVASWLATRMTPRGTVSTAPRPAASPHPTMLWYRKAHRASARARPLTR